MIKCRCIVSNLIKSVIFVREEKKKFFYVRSEKKSFPNGLKKMHEK